jgi:hypothetical protein
MADLESGRLDLWTERDRRFVRSRLNRAFFRNVALRETTSVERPPAGTHHPVALRSSNIRRMFASRNTPALAPSQDPQNLLQQEPVSP